MTTKPPPGKGPAKPFLGDDDLVSELDAWEGIFDALHTGPEEGAAGTAQVMDWPAPASAQEPAAAFSLDEPTALIDEPVALVEPVALDGGAEQGEATELVHAAPLAAVASEPVIEPVLERAIEPVIEPTIEPTIEATIEASLDAIGGAVGDPVGEALGDAEPPSDPTIQASIDDLGDESVDISIDAGPPARPTPRYDRLPSLTAVEVDPLETDFSEIGAAGPASALGDLLGRTPTPPIVATVDDDDDLELEVEAAETRLRIDSGRIRRGDSEADDDVFTSASRPNRAPPLVADDEDDALAPPPAPEPRRGPAIVRRTVPPGAPRPGSRDESRITPPGGHDVSLFAEQTRIADPSELERATATRPVTPAPLDDDAYDDIEIDAAAAPVAPAAEPFSSSRRTAHVLRRGDAPTRPPPLVSAGPVIDLETESEAQRASSVRAVDPVASEDDFSDVAAAVGAADEPVIEAASPPAFSVELDLDDDLDDRPPQAGLDDALAELDAPAAAASDDDAFDGTGERLHILAGEPPETALPLPAVADLYPRVKTPTSVPPLGAAEPTPEPAPVPGPRPIGRIERLATPTQVADEPPEPEPELDLETIARSWPAQVAPLASAALDESCAQVLLVYEREVATLDDSASSAALRIEAGRLSERLSDTERARAHYDAALLADPRATAALRGLRRIARSSGDLEEATRQLDSEIAVAGALERRPLGHYRIDLLMASGDQDLARVAVGEILDTAPSDVRALLAQLELAFLDGRADEFGSALEQLAQAVTDPQLRAAVQSARGTLAAHHNDTAAAMRWFTAAADADPTALAARLGAVRYAVAQADGESAARALLDLARQVEAGDPTTASAAAIRAHYWSTQQRDPSVAAELGGSAALVALGAGDRDPLVARLGAEIASAGEDPVAAGLAFGRWADCAGSPAERAYAAARAAELDPGRGAELWSRVLELDPGDDYAAAQLRTAHVAADATQASIDVDLAVAADIERDRARLRAAYGLIAQGQLDAAIQVLSTGREARPNALALAEALGEALAAAGKWTERARLFAELAAEPGEQLDREVAQLRSALAWEEAVGAAAAVAEVPAGGEDIPDVPAAIASALEAWERVLEPSSQAPAAHAAAIALATRLGDRDVLADVLIRAQAAERLPAAAASLALRRARLFSDDPPRVEALLRDLAPADDPRRTVGLVMAAARLQDLANAAAALEDRATTLHDRSSATEVAALRLRAAQLALDAGDAPRATKLLGQVEQALPGLGVVPDLLAAARRRAGDRPVAAPRRSEPPPGTSAADAFARIVRDAELAASHGDGAAALALYQRALELRPGDPLATVPLIRIATQLREPAPVTSLALAQLRIAEDAGDGATKATAYELLAHIDAELRADLESAQIALESASQADPGRIDLMHRLERQYAVVDDFGELVRLRQATVEAVPAELVRDRAALLLDIAGLATRDQRTELELADLYRAVLATDPASRLALMHLESIVRRSGFSDELAQLEEQIASYFDGDPKTQAAFFTRAGETLAELGQIDGAVQRFGRAEGVLPGHVPALEGWRQAALKGELWIDVAEAATRQAAGASDAAQRAALHHFAGVALMDKALVGEQAMASFRRALDAEPGHRDAFLRLRILLEEDANHDDLATLLAQRLDVEPEPRARIELHRALAELHRNFLSDRDTAKQHYRAILAGEPNDLRAHAAIADIAWEQGAWQEAADALMARARLERQPEVLKTLCFRLGLIYADRLVDIPMALKAFQRALTYQPDDENTLVRLADLATQVGEYKLALGACERLVKQETDPDRRAAHLHRVAKIFQQGFGDTKRAERALNLALDGAPTNDDALQQLVQFYRDARDITSVRVHLNRVAGTMRARVAQAPLEGVPYRVISRAMAARASTGLPGSQPIARAAAELAELLGAAGEPERKLLGEPARPDLSLLAKPEADDGLFPRGVPLELRQIFQLLGDRIAKHVGVDLRPYGATRGDRLRARDNPVAAVAQSVATSLGFAGEIDVYVSTRQPWVMVAEPTSPVSLIIGSSIAAAGGDAIRFAAGGALKLAQASLAIPARLPPDELGVLVIALMRLFQPEFPMLAIDADAVAANLQKLKRLIPTSLLNELRPFALAVDPQRFSHRDLARDLKIAGLRAGLVASGSLLAGLRILASQGGGELPAFVTDPVAQGLVSFALGEDHAAVAR